MAERHLDRIVHRRSAPPADALAEVAERGYPRPLLRRADWTSLDGEWELAIDAEGRHRTSSEVQFDRRIVVPFSPETTKSGIGDTGLYDVLWYRRLVHIPELAHGQRLILHFGAVDYRASLWVNGSLTIRHEGGYTPFSADITEHVSSGEEAEIVLRAEDDASELCKPRGKQDWKLEPHSIWYPRTTGIWQTVWMERVPETRVTALRFKTNLERWEVAVEAHVLSRIPRPLRLAVLIRSGDLVLADDVYSVAAGEVHRRISLSDPGIDDFRNELLWSPEAPRLLDVHVTLIDDDDGAVVDRVTSYTALRSFQIEGDRFLLNGRPYRLRMVLDQGYWPETGLTAPDDAALRRDVELTKALGFNGARKHQKIEDPRYLYWCDRLGLLVWEEMPSAYRFTRRSVERLTKQWLEVLARDVAHPCIVAWVPFNESWGVPNLPDSPAERHAVEALYHLTKTIDPTRPVVGNDGWEAVATDVIGIHDYDARPERIAERYREHERIPVLFKRERPGGRALVLGATPRAEHPIVLSEFGGIALNRDPKLWGYSCADGPEDFERRYAALMRVVLALPVLAGFCYTQLTDTYQEANGLLFMDRTPKIPIERLAEIMRGDGDMPPAPGGAMTERHEAPR
ncbi:glycoside hydrolase family 2 protein [Sandaracinus amylolyticus]|uniref:Beta-galactosidase n=1 Tax=Sandaracinus amylolyticus TaxID=927083 RepID=A0A0F6YGM0_9BACT|nr:glycoside hydrolase family 2 [Sandaracinus amylolyticus]AKF03838.1 Beta-galactosidase [Sandaracinus amylolyticus]